MEQPRTTLKLDEYVTTQFAFEVIPYHLGEKLWRNYKSQVSVDFPSPKTDGNWQLVSQGWVGYIPLSLELGFTLRPKVKLANLFHMLEYAYWLKSFRFLDGLIDCDSLNEFYERLANVLASRILSRGRKGFYRAYIPETDRLPYVRGRLDVRKAMQAPWAVDLHCHYQEHTADVEENQILAWTLLRIAQSGMCTKDRALPKVRRAYRSLRGLASLHPHSPRDCIGRLYNRLNDDYQPMHALCRFFLEHSGPSHEMGDRTVLPFLVNMNRLYELFVAEWLRAHLPEHLALRIQETVGIGENRELSFTIDLVLYDNETGNAVSVLDTKYKASETPSPSDIAQVVAYAEMKGCYRAVLIYPEPLSRSLNERVGQIQVQSLTFSLDGDLDVAGDAFLHSLLDNG